MIHRYLWETAEKSRRQPPKWRWSGVWWGPGLSAKLLAVANSPRHHRGRFGGSEQVVVSGEERDSGLALSLFRP